MLDELIRQAPAIATLLAAYLVYRSGQENARREAADRERERSATQQARAHEQRMKALDNEREASEQAARGRREEQQQERQRYLRFLRAAQQVGLHFHAQEGYGAIVATPSDMRTELADSYEDAMLGSGPELIEKLQNVKEDLDDFETHSYTIYGRFQNGLDDLREAVATALAQPLNTQPGDGRRR